MKNLSKEGIVYLVIDESGKYIDEFRKSYNSLRQFYSGDVTLITNLKVSIDNLNIIKTESSFGDWRAMLLNKPKHLKFSIYEKSIFLDTDTIILDNFSELFKILDHFDFCATTGPMDYNWPRIKGQELVGYLPYNTGVLGYNSSELCQNVIDDWLKFYRDRLDLNLAGNDQTPFLESVFKHKANVCTLPNNYNLRTDFPANLARDKIKILHGRKLNKNFINKVNPNLKVRVISKNDL